jgi:hypothetical protein
MLVQELLREENWLSKAWDTFMHGPQNDELIKWVNDNIRRKGTQWIYRNVDQEFPKRYIKSDVDKAIQIVLGRG